MVEASRHLPKAPLRDMLIADAPLWVGPMKTGLKTG